jgi:hypothetical protein
MKRFMFGLLISSCTLSLGATSQAQYWGGATAGGTVRGTGTVTIERQPQRMQMEVDILFRAGSVEDAVAGLREQIETARLQLVELGALEDSITVGDPSIDTRQSGQQQMMQQMITPFRGPGRTPPAAETQKPVTVTAVMQAAWELDQSETADLLVRTHELQEQIREADVAGSEAATQLTPEEEEVLEEMQNQYGSYGSSDEAKPGEPLFYFVADITDEEYRQALADAFQDARARAEELAAATGSELGALESVVSNSQADIDSYDYNYGIDYQSTYYRAYQRLSNRTYGSSYDAPANEERVAIGVKPGKVSYNVSVSAGFGLNSD